MITNNPYEKRWRWWYSAIADWMIRNPGGTLQDCATELGRGYNTVCMIACTDMFRTYLDQRKAEWRARHDFGLANKLNSVASGGLDLILDVMRTKGNQIPMKQLESLTTGALDRLGYAPSSAPAVQVNVQQNDNRQVTASVPLAALEEARDALRLAEQRQAVKSREAVCIDATVVTPLGGVAAGAELDLLVEEGEELSAPLNLSPQ